MKNLLLNSLLISSMLCMSPIMSDTVTEKPHISKFTKAKKVGKHALYFFEQFFTTNYFSRDTGRFFRKAVLSPWITDNFDVVKEGALTRSSQYNAKKFEKFIQQHNVKIAINLRDNIVGTPRWDALQAVADKYEVQLINLPMNSDKLPTPEIIATLIDIYNNAIDQAMHINCEFGRDRTGFAAAFYKLEIEKVPLQEALKQFSFLRYAHIKKVAPRMQEAIIAWNKIRQESADLDAALAAYTVYYQENK